MSEILKFFFWKAFLKIFTEINDHYKVKGFVTISNFQLSVGPGDDFSSLETREETEYVACTAWEHDTSFWKMTIIMDFDLVCDVSFIFLYESFQHYKS